MAFSEFPELRLVFFFIMLGIMFFLEGHYPARVWSDLRWKRCWFSFKLAVINNMIMRLLVAGPFLLWIDYIGKNGHGLRHVFGLQEGWLLIITTVVFFDFLEVFKHLLFHRIPFMWSFHQAHHTDKHLDIWTAIRYHPGEFIMSAFYKGLGITLWGPDILSFVIFEIILNMANQFHHSNIDFSDRMENFLNRFIVTPRYHALHHTIVREKGDQNFSVIFNIWDRILGTRAYSRIEDINLENLGKLQDHHLSIRKLLTGPFRKCTKMS